MSERSGENELTISFALGEAGFSLENVDVKKLAKLFTSAQKLVDSVARAEGEEAPTLYLRQVKRGSARYSLGCDDPKVVRRALEVVDGQARHAPSDVQEAYVELVRSATEINPNAKVSARANAKSLGRPKLLLSPAPVPKVANDGLVYERSSQLYAVVSFVKLTANGKTSVGLRPIDGGREESFECESDIADHAAKYFRRKVRACVVECRDGAGLVVSATIERIRPWADPDFVEGLLKLAKDFEKLDVDVSPWLRSRTER